MLNGYVTVLGWCFYPTFCVCAAWAGAGAGHKCQCYNLVCYKCRDPSHQPVTVVGMKSIVKELKLWAWIKLLKDLALIQVFVTLWLWLHIICDLFEQLTLPPSAQTRRLRLYTISIPTDIEIKYSEVLSVFVRLSGATWSAQCSVWFLLVSVIE